MRKLSLVLSLAMAFGMCHASNVYLNASNYVVHASEDWVPVKDTTAVKAGSALDFSAAGWIDASAGKYGRVVRKGDHFEFAGKPGVKQRFYGVNLCFTANYMSAADAEELCTRLARIGYNALRIHHYERELCDAKDGTTIRPEKALRHDFSCGPQADIADMWFGWHAPRRGGGRAEGREGFVRREHRPRPGRGDLLLRNRPLRKGMRPLRTYPVLI